MKGDMVMLEVSFSPETRELIEKICAENHLTKDDLFGRALVLMIIALEYKKIGAHLIVVDKNDQKISDIVGV